MHRILIIGNAGAGKSTFARELAQKTQLPLIHLDKLYWHGNWEHCSRQEFDSLLQAELEKPTWIIDGNFNRTIPHRLNYCDTVIFLDFPTITCLWGITHRILKNYGKTRQDMGGDCPELFDKNKLSLYKNVLTFNGQHRKDYYNLLQDAKDTKCYIFKNRKATRKFLNSL